MKHGTLLQALSMLALVGLGIAVPSAAVAQQTPRIAAADTSNLETIVVTAQRRTDNVQSAPLAISAITGANLAKNRVTSITDLAQTMTGISFTANSPQAN